MPMPRLTDQQKREKALRRAIARARVDMDLPRDQDAARTLGLSPSNYSKRKQDPYKGFHFDEVSQVARTFRFTGKELCEIVGIPYELKGEAS